MKKQTRNTLCRLMKSLKKGRQRKILHRFMARHVSITKKWKKLRKSNFK